MTLQAAKKVLRQELKEKLRNMASENRVMQSQVIFKKLLQNPAYSKSKRVCVYLSRETEVDTEPILLDIFNSGKQCFIPRYEPKSTSMDMVRLKSLDEYKNLPVTSWNIKQPKDSSCLGENALAVGGLDLIIVPGVGFTKEGDRIGNGKGYYDLYLKKYRETIGKDAYTIALAFKEQISSFIPTDEKDVKINEVITSE